MMKTKLRQQLLASTLMVGAFAYCTPALAQDQTTPDPAAQPPTGPVEAQPAPSIAQAAPVAQAGDIIITGSRIPQPNLESAAPVTVVSDQDVKLTGSTRIEDVLNQLPSVGAAQASGISNGASGTAEVDLRYLGSKRTLALVNGRRMTPGDPNSTTQAADLNLIPSALIKRVEVLTGGASSVYGADAVAGVVNFILDTNFTGIRFDGTISGYQHKQHDPFVGVCTNAQGNAGCTAAGQEQFMSTILGGRGFPIPTGSDWGGKAIDGTVTLGSAFDDGRGHAVAYFGYRKVKPILQSERDFSMCTIQESITQHGSGSTKFFTPRNVRCGGSATAAPGNILGFPDIGTPLTTSTTIALAPGSAEVQGQNLFNFAPYNYFQRPDERYIAGAFADYEITPAIKPYLEFMFMDDRTLAQIAPGGAFLGSTTSLNCDNPLMSTVPGSAPTPDGDGDGPFTGDPNTSVRDVVCGPPGSTTYSNLVTGFIGNFPVAIGAPYNTVENGVGGTTALQFIDPVTGGTYTRAFALLGRRNVEGGPRIADLKHQSWRGVLGTKGDLSNVWSYDAYFQYGRTDYEQVYKNEFSLARLTRALDVVANPAVGGVAGVPVGDPVCRSAVTRDDPACVPYDVFGAAPSQAAINYLNTTGVIVGQTSEQIANANFTGALGEYGIKTPWAQDGVGVNFGAEYRRESLEVNPDASFIAGDLTGQGAPTLPVAGNFRVWELFGEMQIPIVQDNFIKELSIGLGYRKSWYKTDNDLVAGQGRKYDTDTYKISAEFAPISDIRFRGSYNRAVRAPNIQELFAPQFVGLDGSKDPCAGHAIQANEFGCIAMGLTPDPDGPGPLTGQGTPGNPAGQYNGLLGGNPNLKPEKATTKTAGVVLQPRFIPRFALTLDYWNIKVANAIQGIGADAILTACVNQSTSATNISPACDLVNRNAAGSIWLTPDGFVSDLPGNTSTIKTDGWDIGSSYSRNLGGFLGNLSASFLGTYLHKYKVNNGLTAEYNCAGLYGPVCSSGVVASSAPMPKWRHKARVGLQMPFGLGLSVQWRYVGKVKAETLEDNETLHGPFNVDPGLHIKAQNYFDLATTFTLLNRINLRAGVNNIFDNDPPLVQSGSGALEGSNLCPTGPCNGNTYPGTWDALGRYLYLGATIDFRPKRAVPPPPPPPAPPPPPPAAPATITCPDGLVILANQSCPALPPPPPPPPPAPERGH
jgi:outer membrane receptor protein involved in Fe transport